jgi:hypothetical protein
MNVYPDYTESEIYENECKVGGAVRPPGPYAPTREVAEAIVRGIESDSSELFLSARGRGLALLARLTPGLVERRMVALADALRDDTE